jgi:hypothetical protein
MTISIFLLCCVIYLFIGVGAAAYYLPSGGFISSNTIVSGKGKRLNMVGLGMVADTSEQVCTLKRTYTGT